MHFGVVSGKRVMGMLPQGTLATLVKVDPPMLWNVPDSWTLKEAASVPVVYSTCIYALTVVSSISMTAIHMCQYYQQKLLLSKKTENNW